MVVLDIKCLDDRNAGKIQLSIPQQRHRILRRLDNQSIVRADRYAKLAGAIARQRMGPAQRQLGKGSGATKLDEAPLNCRRELAEPLGALLRILAGELELAIAKQDFDCAPSVS